jgi:hypothetical protein
MVVLADARHGKKICHTESHESRRGRFRCLYDDQSLEDFKPRDNASGLTFVGYSL